MSYTKYDPKWVKADAVTSDQMGFVTVSACGEVFRDCRIEWSNQFLDKSKSDVLVQNSRGDWLRVWFFDEDINPVAEPAPEGSPAAWW